MIQDNNKQPMTRKRAFLIFAALEAHIKLQIPGFHVRYKNEHLLHQIIGVLVWVFNRKYLTTYTTTLYPNVYFPTRAFVQKNPWRAVKILAHEFVHLYDAKNINLYWSLSYLGPQSWMFFTLAFASFVAVLFGVTYFAFASVALALLPWPSAARRDAELRAYTMSMLINSWRYGSIKESTVKWIAKKFTGSDYYFMWPFKKSITADIVAAEGRIMFRNGLSRGLFDKPYNDVVKILEASKL